MAKLQAAKVTTPPWPKLLLRCRTLLNEDQTEFGERFGVSPATISLWEHGKRDMRSEVCWWIYVQLKGDVR